MRSIGKLDIQSSTVLSAAVRNLSRSGRGRKQIVSIVVDASLVLLSLWLAFSLRLGHPLTDFRSNWDLFLFLPIVTVVAFGALGIYRWIVRTSNTRLYLQLLKGVLISSFFLMLEMFLSPHSEMNPRSVFVIYGLLLAVGTCSSRMIWRQMFDTEAFGIPIAIYGMGSTGQQLAGMLKRESEYRPVCFIDDAAEFEDTRQTTVGGLPVLFGGAPDLAQQLRDHDVAQVVIALPSANSSKYLDVVYRLEGLSIPFKTVPSFGELMSGEAGFSEFREMSITDILGRSEIQPDPYLLKCSIEGKSILVTGGGGSIGSELCRQIIRLNPSKLTVLDFCEANLYHITEDIEKILSVTASDIQFRPILCSVTDEPQIRKLFENGQFDTVYHAAAYKHVPIVEANPRQGIEVNVFGTLTMIDAAIATKVANFVLISTDKAVRPSNVMGSTKRIAEMILQAKAQLPHSTIISMVRFGNVLGSSGSVVPKFLKQIEAGGPVTLTHRNITRYFMTIPEASQLVLQSSSVAKGGDVFVLDMGEPVQIVHLAETMIRLHRRQLERAGRRAPDISIEVVGLRPGEKMYEELFIDESCVQTVVPKVFSAGEAYLEWSELQCLLKQLSDALLMDAPVEVFRDALRGIVYDSFQQSVSTRLSNASSHERKESNRLSVAN